MRFGLRNHIHRIYVRWQVWKAFLLNALFGLEHVALLIRRVDKHSVKVILRRFGASIGEDCDIESGLILHNAKGDFTHLVVEDRCHIGKDVFLDLTAPIVLHSRTTISMRTTIVTHLDVGYSRVGYGAYAPSHAKVEIGPDVYIGTGAIILAGVRVGQGSVVGAGALVNRDVPPGVIAAGVPAKVIRELDIGDSLILSG